MNEHDKALILIVEDEARLNQANRHALESEGYEVRSAFTLAEARSALKDISPDVILLDVKLPDGSGFDFCREIRESSDAYIIFLTSVTESSGELEGLTAGGDDYLRKPYGRKLLLERVKKGLRHAKKLDRQIKHGSLTLDLRSDQAFNKGKDMLLTHKEFALLLLFVQNEGRAMSAEHLYEIVWGQPMNRDANAVKNQVYNLRKKLAGSGYTITAVYREGYCFESE